MGVTCTKKPPPSSGDSCRLRISCHQVLTVTDDYGLTAGFSAPGLLSLCSDCLTPYCMSLTTQSVSLCDDMVVTHMMEDIEDNCLFKKSNHTEKGV